jgi:hypothetical protein
MIKRMMTHAQHVSVCVRTFSVALAVAFLPVLHGCAADPTQGYSTNSVFDGDIATIAVPIFENDTFYRDIEFQLTEALVKEIERRTPYKVTAAVRADSTFTGRIRAVELDRLSRSRRTGLTEEGILSVTIDFEWRDLRTNRVLVERRSFSGHGLFVPSEPTSEPIELGRFAAVQQLAADIVGEMQAQW